METKQFGVLRSSAYPDNVEGSAVTLSARELDKKIVGYIIACINLFTYTYRLTVREATNYLNRHKGIEFLINHYEAEHLLSLDDTIEDLTLVCKNNGGGIE